MAADRQAQEVVLRQLQTLLEAQTRLRQAAEEQARQTRQQLERIAEAVCPEEVDRIRCRSPEGLAALSAGSIADLVLARIGPRLLTAPSTGSPGESPSGCESAEPHAACLEARLLAAEERLAQAEARVALLLERLPALEGAATSPEPDPRRMHYLPQRGLVQEAARLLAAAGYTVDLEPGPLPVPDDGVLLPDLTLQLEGGDGVVRPVPVEVEDLSRPVAEREARWEAAYRLGGGCLYFVAPDSRTLDRLRSEVFYWVGSRPLGLWMTDLERGRGRSGETVWLVRRERRTP